MESSLKEEDGEVRYVTFDKEEYEQNVSKRLFLDNNLVWYKFEEKAYVLSRINKSSAIGFAIKHIPSNLKEKNNKFKLCKHFLAENALSILRNSLSETLKFSLCAALYISAIETFGGGRRAIRRVLAEIHRREEKNKLSSSSSSLFSSIWTKSNDQSERLRKWQRDHDEWARAWIEHVAKDILELPKHLIVSIQKLPVRNIEVDGRTFIETLCNIGSSSIILPEIFSALLVSILADGTYDSRSSAAWRKLVHHTLKDETQRVRLEHGTESQFLYLLNCGLKGGASCSSKDDESVVTSKKKKSSSWTRKAMIAGGAVVGGGIVAFTGGLSIPALAVGIGYFGSSLHAAMGIGTGISAISTFLMSSSGAGLATVMFGATGSSLTAYKLNKRTKDISEFGFKFCGSGAAENQHVEVTVFVSGWIRKRNEYVNAWMIDKENREKQKDEDSNKNKTRHDENNNNEDDDTLLIKALRRGDISKEEYAKICEVRRQASAHTNNNNNKRNMIFDHKDFENLLRQTDRYCLIWESKELIDLGNALTRILEKELIQHAVGEALKMTALSAIMSAVVWPAALLKVTDMIDNPWSVAVARSEKAGILLAEALASGRHGTRPIRLIGYSLGSRLILSALLELRRRNLCGIVSDVYLFGLPVTNSREDWILARTVVSGRLVNGFSKNDWVLSYLFRSMDWRTRGIAGLSGVRSPGLVEDYDMSDVIAGHTDYCKKMKDCMIRVCA